MLVCWFVGLGVCWWVFLAVLVGFDIVYWF